MFDALTKNEQITASSFLFVIGAILIGYGFTAIDFSFGDDRWSRDGDRTSDFPLIGKIPTMQAFQLGMFILLGGIVAVMLGAHFTVINYSTVRSIAKVVGGAVLIGWGIWGIAFSFNTAEYRIKHGIGDVDVPCPTGQGFCAFTAETWLFINFFIMAAGLGVMLWGIRDSRYVRGY